MIWQSALMAMAGLAGLSCASVGHYSAAGSMVTVSTPRASSLEDEGMRAFRRYIEAEQGQKLRRGHLDSSKRPKYGARRLRRLRNRGEA